MVFVSIAGFNFQVNIKLLFSSLHRAATEDFPDRQMGAMVSQFVKEHGNFVQVSDLPIMRSEEGMNIVARGRWSSSEPLGRRVRLHFFARDLTGWSSKTYPNSHLGLSAAVRTLQQVLSIIWGKPFNGVLDGVIDALEGHKNLMRYQPIAYLAYRLEYALGTFQVIVFDPHSSDEKDRRRSPAGCASILSDLMANAMDLKSFELYPHLHFFRDRGIYDQLFATLKGFDGISAELNSAAAAGITAAGGVAADSNKKKNEERKAARKEARKKSKEKKAADKALKGASTVPEVAKAERVCFVHVAKLLNLSVDSCPYKTECRFVHPVSLSQEHKTKLMAQLSDLDQKGVLSTVQKAMLVKIQQ